MALLDTFGKRIAALIKDHGDITQVALAQRVGVSEQYISRLVRDKVPRPGAHVICAIAHELDSTADYIMGYHPNPIKPPETSVMDDMDPECIELWLQIKQLPPTHQALAFSILEDRLHDIRNRLLQRRSLGPMLQLCSAGKDDQDDVGDPSYARSGLAARDDALPGVSRNARVRG